MIFTIHVWVAVIVAVLPPFMQEVMSNISDSEGNIIDTSVQKRKIELDNTVWHPANWV